MKVPSRNTTSIALQVDASKEYQVRLTAVEDGTLPPFLGLGREGINHTTGVDGMDMSEIMFSLSNNVNATWLFWLLAKRRNIKTNTVVIEPKDFEDAEVARIKRGRKILEELNLICRYKNNHYLINPKAILPKKDCYLEVCQHWFTVTGQNLNESVYQPLKGINP